MQLLKAKLLVELGNTSAGIDQLLLAREEGVTLRADFHANVLLRGTCLNYITAGAFNRSLLIIGMDTFLHCSCSPLSSSIGAVWLSPQGRLIVYHVFSGIASTFLGAAHDENVKG